MAMRDDSAMALQFRPARSDGPPGSELLAELIDHLNAVYPGRAERPGSVTTADEMVPPDGIFLVGWDGETAVACGGLRRLGDTDCEIKRMYVVPSARRRGAGRALLAALEDAARELGYQRVRLDAGPQQRHSKLLFAQTGYTEIAPYNGNHIADYWAQKTL
jgi:GNAT superfamily N-acetyltransferase